MKINYKNKLTWLGVFSISIVLCYFFIGSFSTCMGVFGFVIGYLISKMKL